MTSSETPQEQQQRVWSMVRAHNITAGATNNDTNTSSERTWPTYDAVLSDVANSNYESTLTCPHDVRQKATTTLSPQTTQSKQLCPFGVAVCCEMQLFPTPPGISPYTGLLTPDKTLQHCIIRLSSAIKPPAAESKKSKLAKVMLLAAGRKTRNACLFPTAALKVFRSNDIPSGNLLFGGCKVGQIEDDYFAHCMCTQMTERMPRALKPFVKKFWQYSQHPLSLGVSDVCAYDQSGQSVDTPNFPFAIILSPCRHGQVTTTANTKQGEFTKDAFDAFIDDALEIPVGTVLFDVFACPHPALVSDPTSLQRIGKITTTSETIPSSPHDGLFFRHQRKEEDYELRPQWKQHLKEKCTLQDGSVGTVEHLAGWELFEEHIAKGTYVDFEKQVAS